MGKANKNYSRLFLIRGVNGSGTILLIKKKY